MLHCIYRLLLLQATVSTVLLYLLGVALLLLLDFSELVLDVLLLVLSLHLLGLHLQLMRHHLVRLSGLTAVLLPMSHVRALVCLNLIAQLIKLLASDAAVVILLLLLKLLKQLLIRLEFEIGNHLVLQARFVLVLLRSSDRLDFFLDGLVLFVLDSLLMLQRSLNSVFDRLDMLEPRQSLQLVQPDSLLEKLLHFSSHLKLPFRLSMHLSLLL